MPKSQRDMIFWHTRFQQFGSNAFFRTVILNPDFAVDQTDMDITFEEGNRRSPLQGTFFVGAIGGRPLYYS
jgi:hypothetical protein